MKKILLTLFLLALTLLSAQTESIHFTKVISYSIMKFDWNVNVYYSNTKLFIELPASGILIESGRGIPVSYDPDKNIIRKNIGSFQNSEITFSFENTNAQSINNDKEAEISSCNWFKLFQDNTYKAKMCIVEDPSVDIISLINNGYEDIIKGFPVYIEEDLGASYEFQSIKNTDTYISIENVENN